MRSESANFFRQYRQYASRSASSGSLKWYLRSKRLGRLVTEVSRRSRWLVEPMMRIPGVGDQLDGVEEILRRLLTVVGFETIDLVEEVAACVVRDQTIQVLTHE